MIDLDELEKLAKAATPGPWHFHQDDGTALDISEVCIPRPEEDVDLSIASLLEDRDGAFIAAANPQAVLELIELVRKAERAHRTVAKLYGKVTAERDAALARIAELEEELEIGKHLALGNMQLERDRALEAEVRIAEAAKLHRGYVNADGSRTEWCSACGNRLPCDTRRALGLNEGDER